MAAERARQLRERAEEAESREMRRLEDTGEISHLYGRPLDLDDDPAWLVTRVLKTQGYSHPLLEAARDLEEPRRRAEEIVARLRRRHRWLSATSTCCTEREVAAFNTFRDQSLREYRSRLEALNRAVRDYNLSVPVALHQLPVRVDRSVARVADEVPAMASRARLARRGRLFRR